MNTVVRSLVVALAVTGAIATSYTKAPAESARISATKTSAIPVPRCPPDDPDACGMTGW